VKPGDPLQKAIDAAPAGATLALAEGAFHERVVITKPLTLRGAGWEKTVLVPTAAEPTDREPTVTIRAAAGVTLRGLRSAAWRPRASRASTTRRSCAARGRRVVVEDCAVLGPFCAVSSWPPAPTRRVRRTLVAGLWNIGVSCSGSSPAGKTLAAEASSRATVRNCYHRCVTLGVEGLCRRQVPHLGLGVARHPLRWQPDDHVVLDLRQRAQRHLPDGPFAGGRARERVLAQRDERRVVLVHEHRPDRAQHVRRQPARGDRGARGFQAEHRR
jgi:hypothetical protein